MRQVQVPVPYEVGKRTRKARIVVAISSKKRGVGRGEQGSILQTGDLSLISAGKPARIHGVT
jgi:hypothetical protein